MEMSMSGAWIVIPIIRQVECIVAEVIMKAPSNAVQQANHVCFLTVFFQALAFAWQLLLESKKQFRKELNA